MSVGSCGRFKQCNATVVSSSSYYLQPSSSTFTSSSSVTKASFALVITNTSLLADCYLSIAASGASADGYSFDASSVFSVVTNTLSSFPAPKLSQALLSDSGSSVLVVFDSITNRAGIATSTSFLCSTLFNSTGGFVASAVCTWLNTTTVSITSSAVITGSTITVLANKVTIACTTSKFRSCANLANNTATSVVVQAALNGITPQPILTLPSLISQCNSFTIDPTASSGNGGRPWSLVKWNVTSTTAALASTDAIILQLLLQDRSPLADAIVTVDSRYLREGTYYVSMTLTNFLGKSSTTSKSFFYSTKTASVSLSILSPNYVSVLSFNRYSVLSTASLVSCGSAIPSKLNFTWQIFESGIQQTRLVSTSLSPRIYSLSAYTLTPRLLYLLQLTVTATSPFVSSENSSATALSYIRVIPGQVVARINGGTSALSISSDQSLDASRSYDQDSSSSISSLSFLWSCSINSLTSFGASCNSVFKATSAASSLTLTSSSITVYVNQLNASTSYTVSVVASSTDGRSGTANVVMSKLTTDGSSSSVSSVKSAVTIASASSVVSTQTFLVLAGRVEANSAVIITWAATSSDGSNIDLSSALTPTTLNFTLALASTGISFPFKIFAAEFTAGSTVTFSLSVSSYTSDSSIGSSQLLISYSEIALSLVGPPSNGMISATPMSGIAFDHTFIFITSNWVSNMESIDSLPLSYDFRYHIVSSSSSSGSSSSTSSSSAIAFLQAASYRSTVSSQLPEGLASTGGGVQVIARAFDSLSASSSVTVIVNVTTIESPSNNSSSLLSSTAIQASNYLTYLSSAVTSSLNASDNDLAISAVNNVALSPARVNCSGATDQDCLSLNRQSCELVSYTCGLCMKGYVGVSGSANTLCVSKNESKAASASVGGIGSFCSQDSDCLYQRCVNSTCLTPLQRCPSSTVRSDCSGHGSCSYFVNGRPVSSSSCTIDKPSCVPKCACNEGYTGASCSVSMSDLDILYQLYNTLCSTILTVSSSYDASFATVDSLSSALHFTSSSIVAGLNVSSECIEALSAVSGIASDGYLDQTTNSADNLLQTLSSFVVQGSSSSLDASAVDLISGVLSQMVDGEQAQDFSSNNLRFQVRRDLITSLANNASLAPTKSAIEEDFNISLPSIQLFERGYEAFDDGSG